MARLGPSAIGIVLVLAVAACATTTPSPSRSPSPAALDGREFLSTSVTENGVERPLVRGTRISLRFDEGHIGASAGCNIMGADYRIEGDRLLVEGGAMTEMGCDEPRHAQDEWLFGFLGADPVFQLVGPNLTLASGTTVIVLVDREVAIPDLPLVGPVWRVDSVITGDVVSRAVEPVVATLLFTTAGEVFIDTGCNKGGADVEIGSSTLRFTDLVITEASCEAPFGELEMPMLLVLQADEVTYSIDADLLRLQAGEHGLELRGT